MRSSRVPGLILGSRIAIARALACEPEFPFLDGPVSSLKMSIQPRVLDQLKRLLRLTYPFVSHALSTVRQFCDRTMDMHRGKVLETGDSGAVVPAPLDAFTQGFLCAVLHLRGDDAWSWAAGPAEDREGPPLICRAPKPSPHCSLRVTIGQGTAFAKTPSCCTKGPQ